MTHRILTLALTAVLFLSACGDMRPAPAGGPTPSPAAPVPTAAPAAPTTAPTASPTALAPAIRVLATQSFLADIAQNVAGDRLTVEALIPLGVDPHIFEPTPADVRKVADSDVLIVNGAGFEAFLERLLENASGERLVIEASQGLTSRTAREGEIAVMSPEELTDVLCVEAADLFLSAKEITAGADQTSAVELVAHKEEDHAHDHDHSGTFWQVALNRQADGTYTGFLKWNAEGGEIAVAVSGGALAMTSIESGKAVEAEETLTLACSGLTRAMIMDVEKGEYLLALSGLREPKATLMITMPGGHHHHDEGDPHFWLDPTKVVTYVANIRDGLMRVDPAGAEVYRTNAERYIAQLNELDRFIAAEVAKIPEANRKLVTNHESFGYFADRYGFRIIGTIVPSVSTGASPSAQQLARLIERVREAAVKVIFLETGANPQLAEQLARETGIRVVSDLYTHSLSDANGPAPTYLDMMRYNVKRIVEALQQG
ncbi:MAG: metal ABC transporter substrate-binding protein [Roseiflexus sp.]|nr:metal ABC transporter substrate-binding protein [Roseiflexus sp.]MDW8147173.1 metal ABC transporter substrate-binding protein [Roseiflexaceae bacterium]MDW8231573.1 metal ABC transporter substrate-binding protein [Roseiflexaceae bacterium]